MDNKIEEAIGYIKQTYPYLFSEFGFKVVYFNPDYGYHWYGFAIGLASKNFSTNLILASESGRTWELATMIASHETDFETLEYESTNDEWTYLPEIIYFLSGKKNPNIQDIYQEKISIAEYLIRMNNYIKPYMDEVFALYEKPGYIKEWLQTQRELNKHAVITIEQIKAERVRLHSLGLDSSLRAALENLKGKND